MQPPTELYGSWAEYHEDFSLKTFRKYLYQEFKDIKVPVHIRSEGKVAQK